MRKKSHDASGKRLSIIALKHKKTSPRSPHVSHDSDASEGGSETAPSKTNAGARKSSRGQSSSSRSSKSKSVSSRSTSSSEGGNSRGSSSTGKSTELDYRKSKYLDGLDNIGRMVTNLCDEQNHVVSAVLLQATVLQEDREIIFNDVLKMVWFSRNLSTFLRCCIRMDLRDATKDTLFRETSATTQCFAQLLTQPAVLEYSVLLFDPIVNALLKACKKQKDICVVDPQKIGAKKAGKHVEAIARLGEALLLRLRNTFHRFPSTMRNMLKCISRDTSLKFKDHSLGSKMMFNFFFLRYLVPSLVNPAGWGCKAEVSATSQRALILLGNVLMQVAKGTLFPESGTNRLLNEWIQKKRSHHDEFAMLLSSKQRKHKEYEGDPDSGSVDVHAPKDVYFVVPKTKGRSRKTPAGGTLLQWRLEDATLDAFVAHREHFAEVLGRNPAYDWLMVSLNLLANKEPQ